MNSSSKKIDDTGHLTHLSNLSKVINEPTCYIRTLVPIKYAKIFKYFLPQTLAEREKQIAELQQQLKQATIDLNENTQLLEEQKKILQSKFVHPLSYLLFCKKKNSWFEAFSRFDKNLESNILKQLKKKLEQAENRVIVLDAKVKHAEEDSLKKAEEVRTNTRIFLLKKIQQLGTS